QVRLVQLVAVDVDDTAADQKLLPRQRYHAFDEVGRVVGGRAKDDDVAALRRMESVVDLVGDQVIVVVQGRPHRKAFDVDRLDREADPDVKDHRKHDDLCNLAQERRGSGTFA